MLHQHKEVINVNQKNSIDMQIKSDGQKIIDELEFQESDLERY